MKRVRFALKNKYYKDKIYFDNIDVSMLSSINIKAIFIERFFDPYYNRYDIESTIKDIDNYSKKLRNDLWKILSNVLPYLYQKFIIRVDEFVRVNYIFTSRGMVMYFKHRNNKCIFDIKNIQIKNSKLNYELLRNKLSVQELHNEIFN